MVTLFRIKFFVGIFFLQMIVGSTATVTGSKEYVAVQNSKRGRINLNLKGVSLKNTLQMLCNRLGKNLLLSSDVSNRMLHMNLQNITPRDAFSVILQTNNLAYKAMAGNVWFVASSKTIGDRTIVKNVACKYADAGEMVQILSRIVNDVGAVIADQRTNMLIIKGTPEAIRRMEKLIEELDRPTKQVYIQAEIVEVSATDDKEFGVEWLWKNANFRSFQGKVGSDFGLKFNPANAGENSESSETVPVPFPTGSGLGIGILNTDVEAVLHALAETNNVNLLSRPRVVTMDNQEAVIEVGDQIPFKKLNQFGVTSFEFKDATVQLVVKPHIIDSEFILLEVAPKADFQNGFTPDGTPIISTRKASTKVKVRSGQTIVIGGLIRDSLIKNQKKVPILGDIPLLGWLFKSTKSTKVKTELIIFITPFILEDEIETQHFQEDFELRKKMRENFK
ncbi:hypothetical protein IH785_13600 [candidate division KSB1 bacterium]|nr:hypothetical protein [candidate division KSB1 bacterium]